MSEMDEASKKYNEALGCVRAGEHVDRDKLRVLGHLAGHNVSQIEADLASASNADFSDRNYE